MLAQADDQLVPKFLDALAANNQSFLADKLRAPGDLSKYCIFLLRMREATIFHLNRFKIRRHHCVLRSRFPTGCGDFGYSATNKGYAHIFHYACATRPRFYIRSKIWH